jgi:hypothetical protein
LESVPVEVVIVSLSTDFPVLGCPIHGGNNRISYSAVVNQAEVQSLSSLHRYASYICHAEFVLQDDAYCLMIPSYERRVKLALKGIYFHYLATDISKSA